jgi:hypothetical protein
LALAIQGPFHADRSGSTAVGLLTPQHPSIPLPVHFDHWHIHIKACKFLPERFTLGGDKEPMQLLFKRVEILHGLVRVATLPQKGLELIHSVSITGHEVLALPCLHRGSPLA